MKNEETFLETSKSNQHLKSSARLESILQEKGRTIRLVLFLAIASFFVFTLGGYNYFLQRDTKTIIKWVVPVVFLIASIAIRKSNRYQAYLKPCVAFLAVGTGFLLAWYFGGWYNWIPGLVNDSVEGWALAKVAEAAPIIIAILIIGKFSGDSPSSLYLKGGNTKLGLKLGLFCIPLTMLQFMVMGGFSLNVNASTIIEWTPWLVIFAFTNSFMEELMFRGLFLHKYEALMGSKAALILISVIFALFHAALLPFMGYEIMLIFVAFLFIEAWLWGRTIQKSSSIWGAVLVHAVADVLFVIVAFGA
jgi:membrane protease YdiL (CAAX protease family)